MRPVLFDVTPIPLALSDGWWRQTCPPGHWGYRVTAPHLTASDVRYVWAWAHHATPAVDCHCGGGTFDPTRLEWTFTHALEHLAVVALIRWGFCQRDDLAHGTALALTVTTHGSPPGEQAVFYFREGLAESTRIERLVVHYTATRVRWRLVVHRVARFIWKIGR